MMKFSLNIYPFRKEALASCDGDRPLIIQFCANDPDILIQAALLAQNHCDAVDLNLGCPQVTCSVSVELWIYQNLCKNFEI